MPDKHKSSKDKSNKKKAPKQAPAADERAHEQSPAPVPAPEQQLGDTPTPPWQMPTPEQKEEARPVRRALREALAEVDSPEKADAVVEELKAATAGLKVGDVAKVEPTPTTTAEAAKLVETAKEVAPPGETAKAVLAETAAVITSAKKPQREAVSQAAQEIFNPQQQGAPASGTAGRAEGPVPGQAATPAAPAKQDFLREAVLRRLKPIDAFDARLFLAINHLPHTPALNRFFYFFTLVFTGGMGWFVLMGVVTLFKPRLGRHMIRESAVPLALATSTVEYPIKSYFKRRRPFIDIIQAIVIGKKPGTWSFPSGHSATAFGGAWLFSRYLPRLRWLWYSIASLTAFSRVYLGDHYPGDVASGSVLGVLLSEFYRTMPWPWRPKGRPPKS
jgi:undecaprenyl-diphosphatase